MKTIEVTWKGITPLIMHSCQCVNPLHPITKQLKEYTSKRTKTEEDYQMISDLEWEGGLYWKDDIGLYIPAENVEATIRNGAKINRKGTDIEKYFNVQDMYIPLDISEKYTKESLKADYQFRDVRQMTVQRARVTRTRPRFDMWKITFIATYDEQYMDLDTVVNAIEYAGNFVGLCDSRPKYGKFVATIKELD